MEISVNMSLGIQIVNFVLLILLLNIVLYRPIRNILAKRKMTVSGLTADIDGQLEAVAEKMADFELGIKEARVRGKQEKDAMIDAAADEERKLLDDINQKAQAELVKVKAKVAADVEQVKASLMAEVDLYAGAIVEKILGRAV